MALSHVDSSGKTVMVDVAAKTVVKRTAIAHGTVTMASRTVEQIRQGLLKKGDAVATARIAGIGAAKQTATLIPLCHNLPLDHVGVDIELGQASVEITASASCTGKTGVEMEALTAVSVAALTVYDMCKAVDKQMSIGPISLLEKKKEPLT
jgi:cyclic pyranopterin monophosphate synthase